MVVLWQLSAYYVVIVFVGGSFWVPQIALNVQRDMNHALHTWYLFGMSGTRLLIPLYFLGYSGNFLNNLVDYADGEKPFKPVAVAVLFLWVGLQVVILRLQDRYGARFFVPKCF